MATQTLISQISSLTTTELVSFISIIGGTAFLMVKVIASVIGFLINNKSMIKSFLGAGERHAELSSKLDQLIKQTAQVDALDKIIHLLEEMRVRDDRHHDNIDDHILDIVVMRKDIEAAHQKIYQQLQDMLYAMNSRQVHSDQVFDNMREILRRNEEITTKILSQAEKIDELVRTAIPEFRGYHKDLTRELAELGRDIALVERSIDSHINNISSVKLR